MRRMSGDAARCIPARIAHHRQTRAAVWPSIQGYLVLFFFSSRRRHTRFDCDWSSDVCSSDLVILPLSLLLAGVLGELRGGRLFGLRVERVAWVSTAIALVLTVGYSAFDMTKKIGRASCRGRV